MTLKDAEKKLEAKARNEIKGLHPVQKSVLGGIALFLLVIIVVAFFG